MTNQKVLAALEESSAKFIDLRFTDTRGKEQHVTISASCFNDDFIRQGKMFDGSSIEGWQPIHQSDLALVPDLSTLSLDPFYQEPTLVIRCTVYDPSTLKPYQRCPRALAQRAEAYLRSTGIADEAWFGPEPEFFIFDDVRWKSSVNQSFYAIDAEEGFWNSDKSIDGGNTGHRPGLQGGYFPLPPVDSLQDIRAAICKTLEAMGIKVEAEPIGTFYVWANLSGLPSALQDGFDFFEAGLKEKVITVPGVFFDVNPEKRRVCARFRNYSRISFGPEMSVIKRGLAKLEKIIKMHS